MPSQQRNELGIRLPAHASATYAEPPLQPGQYSWFSASAGRPSSSSSSAPNTMDAPSRGDEEASYEGVEVGGPTSMKSERKRRREKDRRKEMKEGFLELSQILAHVEPDDSDNPNRKRNRRGSEDGSTDAEAAGMTRIDLISRAIDTVRRLNSENMELKRSKRSNDDKEGLVMVPTLQPSSGGAQNQSGGPTAPAPAPVATSYQAYYQQQPTTVDPRRGTTTTRTQPPSSFYPQVLPQSGGQEHSQTPQPGGPPTVRPLSYGFTTQWGAPPQQYLGPRQQPYYGEQPQPNGPPLSYPFGPHHQQTGAMPISSPYPQQPPPPPTQTYATGPPPTSSPRLLDKV